MQVLILINLRLTTIKSTQDSAVDPNDPCAKNYKLPKVVSVGVPAWVYEQKIPEMEALPNYSEQGKPRGRKPTPVTEDASEKSQPVKGRRLGAKPKSKAQPVMREVATGESSAPKRKARKQHGERKPKRVRQNTKAAAEDFPEQPETEEGLPEPSEAEQDLPEQRETEEVLPEPKPKKRARAPRQRKSEPRAPRQGKSELAEPSEAVPEQGQLALPEPKRQRRARAPRQEKSEPAKPSEALPEQGQQLEKTLPEGSEAEPKKRARAPCQGKSETSHEKSERAQKEEEMRLTFFVPEDSTVAPDGVPLNLVYSRAYLGTKKQGGELSDWQYAGKHASWLLREHNLVSPSLFGPLVYAPRPKADKQAKGDQQADQ